MKAEKRWWCGFFFCAFHSPVSWQVASSGCSIDGARAANAAAAAATSAFTAAHSVRTSGDAYRLATVAPPRSPRVLTNLPVATACQKWYSAAWWSLGGLIVP